MVQPHPLKKKKIYDCFCITLFVILLLFPNFKVTIKVMIKFSTGTIQFVNLTGTVLRDYVNLTTICKTHIILQFPGDKQKKTFPLAKSKKSKAQTVLHCKNTVCTSRDSQLNFSFW